MLFNSAIFIFLFLPITLGIFYLTNRKNGSLSILWLISASLFFYAWWNPIYLVLLMGSVIFNYALSFKLQRHNSTHPKHWLILGIAGNLALLGYFKYTNFLIVNINTVYATEFHIPNIILPLAISFFTFQQIAYLVDTYTKQAPPYDFKHYCLFVTFFPQLIAGPIVHHRDIIPQISRLNNGIFKVSNIEIGITFFIIGLFKKVVLADGLALYANPVFQAAENGTLLTFFAAWGGALAYTLQIYFDFSGYSDMAIGLARLFGIHLPINFNSPYKALNIIEFWRRWHITLSCFLRDYLYIPLGGNRKGPTRRHINLMITMLLGGLWHGAGWTFVFWGGLHGLYLIINHGWQKSRKSLFAFLPTSTHSGKFLATGATFLAVVVAWVFFRSPDVHSAMTILKGMIGLNGIVLHEKYLTYFSMLELQTIAYSLQDIGLQFGNPAFFFGSEQVIVLGVLLFWVWYAPNTQEFMSNYESILDNKPLTKVTKWAWRPTAGWACLSAVMTTLAFLNLNRVSEFLYFRF